MLTLHSQYGASVDYDEKGKFGQTYSFLVDLERDSQIPQKGIVITCKFVDGDFVEHLHSNRMSTLEESENFGVHMHIDVKLTDEDIKRVQAFYEELYPAHDYYRQQNKKEQLMKYKIRSNHLILEERYSVEGKYPYDLVMPSGLINKVWFENVPDSKMPIMMVVQNSIDPMPYAIDSFDESKKVIKLKPYEVPVFNYCVLE
jgi:hypothetical protein